MEDEKNKDFNKLSDYIQGLLLLKDVNDREPYEIRWLEMHEKVFTVPESVKTFDFKPVTSNSYFIIAIAIDLSEVFENVINDSVYSNYSIIFATGEHIENITIKNEYEVMVEMKAYQEVFPNYCMRLCILSEPSYYGIVFKKFKEQTIKNIPDLKLKRPYQ